MKQPIILALAALVFLCVIGLGGIGYLHNRSNVEAFAPVMVEDFESETLSDLNPRVRSEFCCDTSVELVDLAEHGAAGQGVRIELRADNPDVKGSKRSEFRLPAGHFGKTTWYRSRIRLDPDWVSATNPVTLLQWHGVPDKALLEGNRAPPLRLLNWKDQNYVVLNWDTSPRTFKAFTLFGVQQGTMLWIGPDAPGEWEDWVFRVEWHRRVEGRVSVWRNGTLLADHKGYSAYNDLEAPYLKLGIYVPAWKNGTAPVETNARHAFFDDVWEVYPDEAADTMPASIREMIDTLSLDLKD